MKKKQNLFIAILLVSLILTNLINSPIIPKSFFLRPFSIDSIIDLREC